MASDNTKGGTEDRTGTENSEGGEGNREADRRYRKDARKFVEEGRVEDAADNARNMTEEEQRESLTAEEIGKSRARGKAPGSQKTR